MSESYMARWSVEHAGKLVIIDRAGNEVDALAVPVSGERPGLGLLAGSVWSPYPGSEWDEDRPGLWYRPVYRESR
jgi:hypothetical protein